jgi:hypothetical protein
LLWKNINERYLEYFWVKCYNGALADKCIKNVKELSRLFLVALLIISDDIKKYQQALLA